MKYKKRSINLGGKITKDDDPEGPLDSDTSLDSERGCFLDPGNPYFPFIGVDEAYTNMLATHTHDTF